MCVRVCVRVRARAVCVCFILWWLYLSHTIITTTLTGGIVFLLFQMRKRDTDQTVASHGHKGNKWGSWDLKPKNLTLELYCYHAEDYKWNKKMEAGIDTSFMVSNTNPSKTKSSPRGCEDWGKQYSLTQRGMEDKWNNLECPQDIFFCKLLENSSSFERKKHENLREQRFQ